MKKSDIELVIVFLGIILIGITSLIISKAVLKKIITGVSALQAQEFVEASLLAQYYDFNLSFSYPIYNLETGANGFKLDSACLIYEKNSYLDILPTLRKSDLTVRKNLKEEVVKKLLKKKFINYLKMNSKLKIAKDLGTLITNLAFLSFVGYANYKIYNLIESNNCVIIKGPLFFVTNQGILLIKVSGNSGNKMEFKSKEKVPINLKDKKIAAQEIDVYLHNSILSK